MGTDHAGGGFETHRGSARGMVHPALVVSGIDRMAAALQADRPVIAMVSGPIAHTLPWPANLDTVRQAEAAVRAEGATLALVAVWKGRLTIGLEASEAEALAKGGSSLRAPVVPVTSLREPTR